MLPPTPRRTAIPWLRASSVKRPWEGSPSPIGLRMVFLILNHPFDVFLFFLCLPKLFCVALFAAFTLATVTHLYLLSVNPASFCLSGLRVGVRAGAS